MNPSTPRLTTTGLGQENTDTDNLGPCDCEILYRYSLPCKHYLYRVAQTGLPIPRSLLRPRWWLGGPGSTPRTVGRAQLAPSVRRKSWNNNLEPWLYPQSGRMYIEEWPRCWSNENA